MPMYEFYCPNHKCENYRKKVFDGYMSIQEYEATRLTIKCPICSELASQAVSRGVGAKFKGSGFYATDYQGKK